MNERYKYLLIYNLKAFLNVSKQSILLKKKKALPFLLCWDFLGFTYYFSYFSGAG